MFASLKSRLPRTLMTVTLLFALCLLSAASLSAEVAGIPGRYDIADVVDEVSPAVVNVNTIVIEERTPFRAPWFFEEFFREQIPEGRYERPGVGSGFIVSEDGLVLTNFHVIKEAEEITVTLANGTKINNIEIVGTDSMTDIAVLKLPQEDLPEDLPTVKLGDSDAVRVGEWVIAIGNPYAFQLGDQHTVTAGIISAKNRTVEAEGTVYEDFLQTDAPINPGNSGGPLLNLDGEVIGINTAIIPFAQGIGFAIPINKAQNIMDELVEYGRVIRPWLGVYLNEITPEIADYLDLPEAEGALIQYVAPDSPASEAGLERGDVIIEINRTEMRDPQDVVNKVGGLDVGEKAVIVVIRDGHLKYIVAEIGERP